MKYVTTFLACLVLFFFVTACGGGSGGGGGSSAVAQSSGGDGGGDDGGGGGGEATETEQQLALAVLDLVNAERTVQGLAPVTWRDDIAAVAFAHSVDMDDRGFWSDPNPHVNPDGQDPGDRLAEAGVANTGWGENIAYGYATPEAVMTAWMNSPSHRSNILNPIWTHMGVGVRDGPNPAPFWTQDFIRAP